MLACELYPLKPVEHDQLELVLGQEILEKRRLDKKRMATISEFPVVSKDGGS